MDSENTKCCAKCRWFDIRTQFCRFNPPTPILADDGNSTYIIGAWPKINVPLADYCSRYDANQQKKLL